MNDLHVVAEGSGSSEDSFKWNIENLAQQVWNDLDGSVPRTTVHQTVTWLLTKYDDAVNRRYVPQSVRREARELLGASGFKEIEAKFAVPDAQLFWRLQAVSHLAGYALSAPEATAVWDTYMDTRQRRMLAGGYSCRRRQTQSGLVMTLKSLDRAEGAIHRRQEMQVRLTRPLQPADWPDSAVRDRVLKLISQEPLLPLFDLRQTRMIRRVQHDGNPVAEWSLDSVTLTAGGQEYVYRELEVELLPRIPEDVLSEITTCLQGEWGLTPEPRSKFERALALLDSAPINNELNQRLPHRGASLLAENRSR